MTHRYFYPRSPCGERRILGRWVRYGEQFLSTLSLRRATSSLPPPTRRPAFLSTLSLRRATGFAHRKATNAAISIHALLAESDRRVQQVRQVRLGISIHALLAESDILGNVVAGLHMSFLSTLSLRRATSLRSCMPTAPRYFYPRSPCGERLELFAERFGDTLISIHALLAESDLYPDRQNPERAEFLSTLSLRRATITTITTYTALKFLSTLSLRRATR